MKINHNKRIKDKIGHATWKYMNTNKILDSHA